MSTSRGRSGGRRASRAVDRRRRLRTVDETSAGGLVVDHLRLTAALIGRLDRLWQRTGVDPGAALYEHPLAHWTDA